jgi:hypothetical protein
MKTTISSGIGELDQLIGGFLPGDSVIWQTDDLKEYSRFARGFAKRTIADGRECTYLRLGVSKQGSRRLGVQSRLR